MNIAINAPVPEYRAIVKLTAVEPSMKIKTTYKNEPLFKNGGLVLLFLVSWVAFCLTFAHYA